MIHDVDAVYDGGAFRPVEPLSLPEGARVHLRIEQRLADANANGGPDYGAWLEKLSGRWHGDFSRGPQGNWETRESMS